MVKYLQLNYSLSKMKFFANLILLAVSLLLLITSGTKVMGAFIGIILGGIAIPNLFNEGCRFVEAIKHQLGYDD